MDRKQNYVRIGKAIRAVRVMRGEKAESMAMKLGYKDASSYSKIERGECETLDLQMLLDICDILHLSLFNLLMTANINVLMHKGSITSWNEFYHSMKDNTDEETVKLLNLASNLPGSDERKIPSE